jgi:SAM-dependent methyltransferase
MSDAPDFAAATTAAQQTWSEGDFSMVASMITGVAEGLADALEILPDERVLDVACGSGNGAIAAARRSWGGTVGADFVPELLERGRERAAAERLAIEFVEADAQDLPFEDASFDATMSIFGAMFAPDQERTAHELLRVTRPGGRIGMCNWIPDGRLAKLFALLAKYTGGPPPGTVPPVLWGKKEHARELFGDGIAELRTELRCARQTFRSAEHYMDFFGRYFGPLHEALANLTPETRPGFEAEMLAYLEDVNTSDRALVLEPEYLRLVAIRA